MRLLLLITCLIAISGCATPYQKLGLRGGYSDREVKEGVYLVNFEGNASLKEKKAWDYALLRSAEIALTHGYQFFIIEESETGKLTRRYMRPSMNATGVVGVTNTSNIYTGAYSGSYSPDSYVETYEKPAAQMLIQCYHNFPDGIESVVFNAKQVLGQMQEKYHLKLKPVTPLQ